MSMTFILILTMMLSVAFFTLIERKYLALMQNRKGPNKVSIIGILQPVSDLLKLLKKESIMLAASNLMFYFWPGVMLFISMTLWVVLPSGAPSVFFSFSILIFLVLMSINVYPLTLSGWWTNSKYSGLGAVRSLAQVISYEISLVLALMSPLIFYQTLCLNSTFTSKNFFLSFMPMACLILFISSLAEINRTPFDLVEGESELVSGFNTEFSSFSFIIVFLSEYMMILIMSFFLSMFFLSWGWLLPMVILYIFVRASYPRMRYDKLMMLAWHWFLPLVISLLIVTTSLIMLLNQDINFLLMT